MNSENSWRVAVSTDIATGIPLHHPVKAVEMYNAAGLSDFGVELVPIFYGTLVLALASINGNQLPPDLKLEGIHGRMGALPSAWEHGKGLVDYGKIKLLDLVLPYFHPWFGLNLDKLAKKQGSEVYYNVHHELVAYSENVFRHYFDRFRGLNRVILAVENGPTTKGLELTHEVVARYRDNGLNAVATIDVLHAALELNGYDESLKGIQKVWARVLKGIASDTRQVHFPIGKVDNLPVMEMIAEKAMIGDLVSVLKESKVHVITIENQHGYFTGISKKERQRLGAIIPELVEMGLINERFYQAKMCDAVR